MPDNTGYVVYGDLQEINVDTGLATGSTKTNDPSDPDYFPPVYDPDTCPPPVPDSEIKRKFDEDDAL